MVYKQNKGNTEKGHLKYISQVHVGTLCYYTILNFNRLARKFPSCTKTEKSTLLEKSAKYSNQFQKYNPVLYIYIYL